MKQIFSGGGGEGIIELQYFDILDGRRCNKAMVRVWRKSDIIMKKNFKFLKVNI